MSAPPPGSDPAAVEPGAVNPALTEPAAAAADPAARPGTGEPATASRRGVQAVAAETFSFSEAVGGVRGVVEAIVPGTLFITVYVLTKHLPWSLGAAVGAALIAVVLRLAQRTPVTQALGGLLGIGIGVVWAWRSGEAQNFFAWGLWTNAIYLVAVLVSIIVRWPAVGLFVEAVRAGFMADSARERAARSDAPFAGLVAWRRDRALVRRYTVATWLWVGMFALRLAVQLPLFLDESIGWLGTARLVLGVPLWGLVLWLTWTVVRGAHDEPDQDDEQPAAPGETARGQGAVEPPTSSA